MNKMNKRNILLRGILQFLYEEGKNHKENKITFREFFKKFSKKEYQEFHTLMNFPYMAMITEINTNDRTNPKDEDTIKITDYGIQKLELLDNQGQQEKSNEINKSIKNAQIWNVIAVGVLILATLVIAYFQIQIGNNQTRILLETSLKVEPSLVIWGGNEGRTGTISADIESITKKERGLPIEICVTNEGLREIEKVRIFLKQHDFLIYDNVLELNNISYSEPPKCDPIFIRKHGCTENNSKCNSEIEDNETKIVFNYFYENKQGEYALNLCLFESNDEKGAAYCINKANYY